MRKLRERLWLAVLDALARFFGGDERREEILHRVPTHSSFGSLMLRRYAAHRLAAHQRQVEGVPLGMGALVYTSQALNSCPPCGAFARARVAAASGLERGPGSFWPQKA